MAKKAAKSTETRKPSTRAKRVKPAETAAPEAEPSVVPQTAKPSLAEIRDRAYQIFRTGVNQSDPVADWFQAERELEAEIHV